ncbi:MAG: universal stress protein [Crocinitomicaceae bacterium]|nr:universal stress protein [Crocinitomicaceae bacterium]
MNQNPLYLIPFDFTPVSESAVRLGLDLAIANNGRVTLLNIVKNQSEKLEAKFKYNEFLATLSESDRSLMTVKVIVGELFEDISKAGELLDASLIVMGTHGAKGFQKIFGSNAVKMISNSDSPFLITQGKKTVDKIKTIVMPFSFDKKSIQVATFAGKIAKKFNACIHVVGYHDGDDVHDGHSRTNQIVVKKYLEENNVNHVIASIDKKSGYEKSLMKYAADNDADLIAAGYYKDGIFTNPNSFIQAMIENELHLPLLTVNAEGLTSATGGSAGSGY